MSLRDTVSKRKAERDNGAQPKKRGIAAIAAAKRTEREQARKGGLAALKQQKAKQRRMSSKLDINDQGIRYHDAHVRSHGDERPWGTVKVTNGNMTFEFHNRYGSWMHTIEGRRMAEPAAVARAMGINTQNAQVEISQTLTNRFNAELRALGIPNTEERLREREAKALAERRKRNKHIDNADD